MTTQSENNQNNENKTGNEGTVELPKSTTELIISDSPLSLTKPTDDIAADAVAETVTGTSEIAPEAVIDGTNFGIINPVIHVGPLGNIKDVVVDPDGSYSASDVIRMAEFNPDGYVLRICDDASSLDSPVQVGQTVLLLKALAGAAPTDV